MNRKKMNGNDASEFDLLIMSVEQFYSNTYDIINGNMMLLSDIIEAVENDDNLQNDEYSSICQTMYDFNNYLLNYLSECQTFFIGIIMCYIAQHRSTKCVGPPKPDKDLINREYRKMIGVLSNFNRYIKLTNILNHNLVFYDYDLRIVNKSAEIQVPLPLGNAESFIQCKEQLKEPFTDLIKFINYIIRLHNIIYRHDPDISGTTNIYDFLTNISSSVLPNIVTLGLKINTLKDKVIHQLKKNDQFLSNLNPGPFTSKYKKYKKKYILQKKLIHHQSVQK